MTIQILGLHGHRGVGKDTVADYLVRFHGFTKVAFADRLREEVAAAWNVDTDFLVNPATKNQRATCMSLNHCRDTHFIAWFSHRDHEANMSESRTPRWCLQIYSDYQKSRHTRYYYVDALQDRLDTMPHQRVVVSDVRYRFEAALVMGRQGSMGIVEVLRPGCEANLKDVHSSDERLPESFINRRIHNDGSLAELRAQIDEMMKPVVPFVG